MAKAVNSLVTYSVLGARGREVSDTRLMWAERSPVAHELGFIVAFDAPGQ
ncbi:MAG: hypothetical protein ABGY41_18305 [Candidatus Poribacteria bacterium]